MDAIDRARTALLAAEDEMDAAVRDCDPGSVIDRLACRIQRLEVAYFAAVDAYGR